MKWLPFLLVSVLAALIAVACGSGDDDDDDDSGGSSADDCAAAAETIFTECRVELGHTSAETPGLIDTAQDWCYHEQGESKEFATCLEEELSHDHCTPGDFNYSVDDCCMFRASCFDQAFN